VMLPVSLWLCPRANAVMLCIIGLSRFIVVSAPEYISIKK
jgi:hypothetical protein